MGSHDYDHGDPIKVVEKDNKHIALLCRASDPVRHESIITFYADDPRIDFQNSIHQNFDGLLHWSFNFNIETPEVWHEEVGAVIKAKTASAGGHYADRMARYDYLTLNHFLNVGNRSESITLSNADCLFFRLGNSTPGLLDMNSSAVHVLVGGQVNENLGVIKQDGDTLFYQSFSLLPQDHAFNAVESMRFSLEHQNPLIAGEAFSGGNLTEKSFSLIRSDNDSIILWTLKPGEEDGLTMRFWNLGKVSDKSRIQVGSSLARVMHSSHVETDISEIPVSGNTFSVDLNRQQLKTYHLWLKDR